MIVLTRLNKSTIGLNPDQIQRVESTPDTVITLNDDKRFLVLESVDEVVHKIAEFRAYVLALANTIDVSDTPRPSLHLVPDGPGPDGPGPDGTGPDGAGPESPTLINRDDH